jgi:hypothetical protein
LDNSADMPEALKSPVIADAASSRFSPN